MENISKREEELIKFRDNRTYLTVTLTNGETIVGAIRWFDAYALRLVQEDRSELTVHLHAIVHYRARV